MTDIKKGDWIRVPKGTVLAIDYGTGYSYKHEETSTSRDVIVQVSEVELYGYWWNKLTKEQHKQQRNDDHGWSSVGHRTPTKTHAEWVAVAEANAGHTLQVVKWSNGKKGVFAHLAEKVEAPAPRKKPEPKVNKRQQMVIGSRWEATQDVTIQYKYGNPLVIQGEADWEQANPRPQFPNNVQMVNGVAVFKVLTHEEAKAERKADDDWRNAVFAERKRLIKLHGEHIIRDYLVLKAGDIVKVAGKFLSSWTPGRHFSTPYVSNIVPLVVEGRDDQLYYVEYQQIADFLEAEEIPTVQAFVLRYKPTGMYFKATDWEGNARYKKGVDGQQMVDTFMKGKKWDNIGKAKTSILMATGYYHGLPGADEALPDWTGGGDNDGSMEINDDWELVEFDKLGRREVRVVEEFQAWFKRSWELRALTMRYGSAVRTVYKALEKAGKLDEQKGMVVFTVTDKEALDTVGYWDRKTALTEEDKADIELATASMKKGSFKKAIDHKSMAVSFANKNTALMFKLAYTGNLKVTVLDLEEMKEVVDG